MQTTLVGSQGGSRRVPARGTRRPVGTPPRHGAPPSSATASPSIAPYVEAPPCSIRMSFKRPSRASESEHVLHPVEPRRLAHHPLRRPERAPRELGAARGPVRDLQPLSLAEEEDRVL